MIRFIDLFSGIGGFHLGLEEANQVARERVGKWRNDPNIEKSESRQQSNHNRGFLQGKETENFQGVSNAEKWEKGIDGDGFKRANQSSGKYIQKQRGGGTDCIGNGNISNRETREEGWDGGNASSSFRCVWSCDNDRYANQIYIRRFKPKRGEHYSGDIRRFAAKDIPDHDLLCAGFPCQAFSVAGKRRGLEEARGTLFYEIARIAEHKRPRILLLENVKGLLSHGEGKTFGTILEVLGSLGYWCEWQVLNSKWFGVPQNRERVFIIGHLGEQPRRTVFPVTEIGGNASEAQGEARGDGARVRDENQGIAGSLRVGGSGLENNLIAGTPSHRYGKDGSENLIQVGNLYENKADAGRVYSDEGVARTLKGESGGLGGKMGLYEIQPLKFLNMNQKNFGKEAMTVDTVNSTGIREGTRIRRLTPLECERLQGFPDGWTESISDTQRYKCLGNAVTVNVIRFLGERISQLAEAGE